MRDGLYIVDYKNIYAAFVVRDGNVTNCAPVLRKNLQWFKKIAVFLPTEAPPLLSQAEPRRGQSASRVLVHDGAEASPFPEVEDQCPPVWRTGCE